MRRVPPRPSPRQALARLLAPVIPVAVVTVIMALASGSPPAADGRLAGPARIIDGDTIVIDRVHARRYGIDAPESEQSCQDADQVPTRLGQKGPTSCRLGPHVVPQNDKGLEQCALTPCFNWLPGRDSNPRPSG
jgi:hypothetical protein